MQTLAQPGTVLVSKDVHKMTRDFFKFTPLGKLAVKGKEEAVEAFDKALSIDPDLKPAQEGKEQALNPAAGQGLDAATNR
jgi:hypothetical protein